MQSTFRTVQKVNIMLYNSKDPFKWFLNGISTSSEHRVIERAVFVLQNSNKSDDMEIIWILRRHFIPK